MNLDLMDYQYDTQSYCDVFVANGLCIMTPLYIAINQLSIIDYGDLLNYIYHRLTETTQQLYITINELIHHIQPRETLCLP